MSGGYISSSSPQVLQTPYNLTKDIVFSNPRPFNTWATQWRLSGIDHIHLVRMWAAPRTAPCGFSGPDPDHFVSSLPAVREIATWSLHGFCSILFNLPVTMESGGEHVSGLHGAKWHTQYCLFFSVGVILSSCGTQSKNKAHREDVFLFGLL